MNTAATLWLYFVVVFSIVALPGLDMAFVMGSSMLGGRRAGMAAVFGIMAGGVCHVVMGALGAAIVLRWFPALFQLMLAGGAVYIAWMGLAFLRSSGAEFTAGAAPGTSSVAAPGATFRRAMLTALLNPKAYIFMLAIFPQFLKPANGPVWVQAVLLGLITVLTQLGVYGALALVSSRAASAFLRNPGAAVVTARVMGILLLAVACLTAAQLWNPPPAY